MTIYAFADEEVAKGVKLEWMEAFEVNLRLHIKYVQEACRLLQVPTYQVHMHDDSKWSHYEFPYYARQFNGDGGDPLGFARAWLHHQNHNPHHWEYWMPRTNHVKSPDGEDYVVNGCMEMPEHYAREMVADWMGASMTYTGSWDMSEWLSKNLPRIRLHPNTRELVKTILESLGYYCMFDAFANRYYVSTEPPTGKRKAINP